MCCIRNPRQTLTLSGFLTTPSLWLSPRAAADLLTSGIAGRAAPDTPPDQASKPSDT
jgi:hypothetical protein